MINLDVFSTVEVIAMKWACGIQYNGTNYHGLQTQQSGISTIQAECESALSFVANHIVTLHCAGRTDAGVHAVEMIAHFESSAARDKKSWLMGVNSRLPHDISLLWIKPISADFHARFSAIARQYRYIIHNSPVRHALSANMSAWVYKPLDIKLMQDAAKYFIGEHDFTSFRGPHCQASSPVRHIDYLMIKKNKTQISVDIRANGFLHNMVRNIVGLLIEIGKGKYEPEFVQKVLLQRTKQKAAPTAPASGLYFVTASYPENFTLPKIITEFHEECHNI